MKKILLLLFVVGCFNAYSQQNMPVTFPSKQMVSTALDGSQEVNHFFIYGIGNLSDETLKSLNAGGKLAISYCPHPTATKMRSNFFASFNKNASNTDSLLSTVLVFPEVGSHSFLITSQWINVKEDDGGHQYNGPFIEFVTKKIKKEVDSGEVKNFEVGFNTLHFTGGYKWGFSKRKVVQSKEYETGCNVSVFLSYVNIPNEDHKSFEKIANMTATKNSFYAAGVKFAFEINGFQIFADMRHVFGSDKSLPLKDLRGFNSNIGVAFNTDIFRF